MGVRHERVSITTSPTQVSSDFAGRRGQTVSIQNPGSSTVYLGGSDVTSSSYGFELGAGITFSIDLFDQETLYGVVASGTQTVNVIRQGV
jgi:hypothetical protein